jgi:hypothetical protein
MEICNQMQNALGIIELLQFRTWLLEIKFLQFQKQTPTIISDTFIVVETLCRKDALGG